MTPNLLVNLTGRFAARRSSANRYSLSVNGRREGRSIQFLLGHVSIQTTERNVGRKRKLRIVVNDRLGIETRRRLTATTRGRMLQSALRDFRVVSSAAGAAM